MSLPSRPRAAAVKTKNKRWPRNLNETSKRVMLFQTSSTNCADLPMHWKTRFEIQIAGERISVPVRATFSIEHEKGEDEEEVEFQIKWSLK